MISWQRRHLHFLSHIHHFLPFFTWFYLLALSPPPLLRAAQLLVGRRASGVSALPLQPPRLHLAPLRRGGPLHLPARLRGPPLRPAAPGLRAAGDAAARGARAGGGGAAEMGRAVPHRGVSQGGVQAQDRGNTRCMAVSVVCCGSNQHVENTVWGLGFCMEVEVCSMQACYKPA